MVINIYKYYFNFIKIVKLNIKKLYIKNLDVI